MLPSPILVNSPPYRFSSFGIAARVVHAFVANVYFQHFWEALVIPMSFAPQQIKSPFISTHLDVLPGESLIWVIGLHGELVLVSAMNLVLTTSPELGLVATNIANTFRRPKHVSIFVIVDFKKLHSFETLYFWRHFKSSKMDLIHNWAR